MRRLGVLGAVFLLTISGAAAEVDTDAIAQEIKDAFKTAQANAGRPGDEGLSCDQLLMELESSEADPALRERRTALKDEAQEAMRRYESAKTLGRAMSVGRIGLDAAVSGNQWAEYIGLLADYVQLGILTAQQDAAAPLVAAIKANVLAIMPHYGRVARVWQLARGQGCAFVPPARR